MIIQDEVRLGTVSLVHCDMFANLIIRCDRSSSVRKKKKKCPHFTWSAVTLTVFWRLQFAFQFLHLFPQELHALRSCLISRPLHQRLEWLIFFSFHKVTTALRCWIIHPKWMQCHLKEPAWRQGWWGSAEVEWKRTIDLGVCIPPVKKKPTKKKHWIHISIHEVRYDSMIVHFEALQFVRFNSVLTRLNITTHAVWNGENKTASGGTLVLTGS